MTSKFRDRLRLMFSAVQHRNFRVFFLGHGLSLVGTWIQNVAMSWLAYRLTDSPLMLGLVAFASQIPSLFLSPVSGVLADRMSRKRVLFITQSLAMLHAFLLAALTLSGNIAVWHLLLLSFFIGCVHAFDTPTRQALLLDIVETKEALKNAIALNAMVFNSIRLIGPLIGGWMIAQFGEGWCFLINGVSFTAVLISLSMISIRPSQTPKKEMHLWHDLKEGFHYALAERSIRAILQLLSVVNVMGFSFVILIPVFAKSVLGGGPVTLGLLTAAIGSGALVATLIVAAYPEKIKFGPLLPASSALFAIALMMFAASRSVWLSAFFMAVVGFSVISHMLLANTLLQTLASEEKRGRIVGFYTMSMEGLAPFGALLAGALASMLGPTPALIIGGLCCMLAAAHFHRVTRIPLAPGRT